MNKKNDLNIPLPGGTLKALCFGDPNNPPILALHGWLDNAASFDHLAPLFSDFYLVALDFAGHGFSDHKPAGIHLHITDYIADVLCVIDALNWKRCLLMGHSLGAAIALLVAGCIPEKIQALGLIDGLGPFTTTAAMLPMQMKAAISEYQQLPNKRIPLYKTQTQAIAARLRASPMHESSVLTLISRGLKKTDAGYVWRNDPRLLLKPLLMMTEDHVEIFLKSIIAPVCFIRPDHGWPFGEALLSARAACIENLVTHQIPGQHHVHLDSPDSIANILVPFFNEHSQHRPPSDAL